MDERERVNILLVDDDPAKLLSYEATLSALGENLITARSGHEALQHLLTTAIPVKRDKLPSIAYSEELIFSMSATLQSTDRRHGIVGQERCHFQRDS